SRRNFYQYDLRFRHFSRYAEMDSLAKESIYSSRYSCPCLRRVIARCKYSEKNNRKKRLAGMGFERRFSSDERDRIRLARRAGDYFGKRIAFGNTKIICGAWLSENGHHHAQRT